ncbi:SLC13 family permease [Congregibacter litoralis]|uniref:Anion transporter n=1 Tax=Congregibacter litoralis KT71 TaxID=314285 RepID=A4A9I0_9GAMM|nr:SLC13 family permease [Congregibacter litoralis]EAQ97147.1 anion transporter [Congregibacter litoralis KT71]
MRAIAFYAGPMLALAAALLAMGAGQSQAVAVVLAVAVICIVWWIFEPIAIPVTSLIPLAVLPLAGVLTPAEVGEAYGSPLILLLLGGFLLSQAMESSGAHRRIALGMIHLFGAKSPRRLVLGFMAAAAVLSMWISNTATTLMLLPVALAMLEGSEDKERLAVPLLLGLAYAASVGGVGTPIGTPPNLIFMQVYQEYTGEEMSFTRWMSWGVPVVLLLVPAMAWSLTRGIERSASLELPVVGAWRSEERRVLAVFGLTALAWITRSEPFGGWRALLDLPQANDASVALLAVVLMCVVPNGRGGRLLDWEQASRIPWGVLLLFAGGICLAKGFVASGLSDVLGQALASLIDMPTILLILVVCLAVTFMTEATSNTASTTLLMPVLAAAALAASLPPELIMVPAAMSASCAFMLPVATAPNSVVFGSGLIKTTRMAREGLMLNFIAAAVVTLVCFGVMVL